MKVVASTDHNQANCLTILIIGFFKQRIFLSMLKVKKKKNTQLAIIYYLRPLQFLMICFYLGNLLFLFY